MKNNYKLLIIGLLVCCAGCVSTHKVKQEFNLAAQDPQFQNVFAARTIRLVAPASGIEPEKIQAIQSIKDVNVLVPENLMSNAIAFHANTDEERFLLLKAALYDNSNNTVVWSLRGGYGSARVIDKLKKLPKPKHEKIFIGYSDITALHLFLSQYWHWKTIHGNVLSEILNPRKDPKNFLRIADIIAKNVKKLEMYNLVPLNQRASKLKRIAGRLTGGNLSVVQTSIGTSWQINPAHKILFLEEVGEKGYEIDRLLHHLTQAGILKEVKAIVFGTLTDCKNEPELALLRFASETNIPVFKTDEFGHGEKNYPLVYNALTEIIATPATEDFTLIMHLN